MISAVVESPLDEIEDRDGDVQDTINLVKFILAYESGDQRWSRRVAISLVSEEIEWYGSVAFEEMVLSEKVRVAFELLGVHFEVGTPLVPHRQSRGDLLGSKRNDKVLIEAVKTLSSAPEGVDYNVFLQSHIDKINSGTTLFDFEL